MLALVERVSTAPAIYLALLSISCVYALARGGAPERLGVGILLAGVTASAATPQSTRWRHQDVEVGLLLVDLAMLVAIAALAARAQRYWPIWWGGLKLCAVIVHLMMFAPLLMPWSYAVASAALSFPTPLILAGATLRHRRRIAKFGADPAWSEPAHWRDHELPKQQSSQHIE